MNKKLTINSIYLFEHIGKDYNGTKFKEIKIYKVLKVGKVIDSYMVKVLHSEGMDWDSPCRLDDTFVINKSVLLKGDFEVLYA
jgi:hypothetical protein